MKVHEYQAKDILEHYGVAMQPGIVARSVEEAVEAARTLQADGATLFVVKAQIHAGGRGKGGGVKLAHSLDEVRQKADAILGMNLVTHQTGPQGQPVRALLIAAGAEIAKEYYVGITLDRGKSMDVIMASTEGGVEIETVAEETPEKIIKVWIDPAIGMRPYQARQIAFGLGFEGTALKQAIRFITALYKAYVQSDASLAEINPLVLTEQGNVIAVDAKITLDDNALFRHKDLAELRDLHEEDPLEVEADEHHLNYIKLDGNVGCMVNGAGLAMASMDLIKLAGGDPARVTARHWCEALRQGDAYAERLRDDWLEFLSLGLAGIIVSFDPDVVVLGTIVQQNPDLFIDELAARVRAHGHEAAALPETVERARP